MAKWTLGGVPFTINPQGHGEDYKKRIHTIGILQGEDVLQEGEPETPTMPCDITVVTQAAKEQFDTWYATSGTQTLIDDHGTSRTVLIVSLNWRRQFATNTDWYYTATITFRILS